jgi:hypothetical protein
MIDTEIQELAEVQPLAGNCATQLEAQQTPGAVRVVPIQELPEVTSSAKAAGSIDMSAYWKRQKCKCRQQDESRCQILTSLENCSADFHSYGTNAVFTAFQKAYNEHQDILLAPDDIWLLVCLQFPKYVNKNPERLRSLFVAHEGKKNLTVTTWRERSESKWEEFLDLIKVEISKNTTDGIVDVLQSDFSTSGLVERMVSTAAIMDSFKEYFSYGRCIPMCGIRNACFLGTAEDWDNLLVRIDALMRYDVDSTWSHYISKVQDIVRNFIATYHGDVDVKWWNEIMDTEFGRLGSGSTTYYSGWILHLFGKYEKCESDDIGNYSIDVPVKIDNRQTGELKTVHLVGGLAGVHAMDVQGRKAFRPQTSLIVFYDPASEEDKAAASQHFRHR